jgi:hypothetical protein
LTSSVKAKDEIDSLDKINSEYLKLSGLNKNQPLNIEIIDVDSFVAKYSSDELESLKDIIHKDRQMRMNKHFWMYETEYKANEKLKALKSYDEEFLKLPQAPGKHFEKPLKEFAEVDAKNSLFFPPDYSNTNDRAKRSEISMNPAMLGPSYLEKDITEGFENRFTPQETWTNEKHIVKENTRLPYKFVENLVKDHSNKIKKRMDEAYENSDVVKLLRELKEIEEEEKKLFTTPNINGYKLLKEPSSTPGEIDKNPLFTWGEVASTPIIIKENRFSVPQSPIREDIAHSLASKKNKELPV